MTISNNRHRSVLPDTGSRLSLALSFLLPTVIMLGILAGKEIYPFGDNSFLRTDMYHQYAPFFAEFARILKEGRSLTYTFEIGLGTNFAALYAYYLASPLNWLVFFVPSGLIIEFMTYTIVAKIGLCGLSLAYYLKKHFHTDSLAVTFFGVCYAMCGYVAAYSWNIMWMDSLWLAPLILLGAEQLIEKGRPALYVITLGLAILCNYYIAIMICIFLVLYFFCRIFLMEGLTWKLFLKRGLLFALYSLLAGGIAAVMLFPAALALSNTASADSTFPSSLTCYFGILEMLAHHMMLVETEVGLDHWPNIYSGVFCLFLMPVYVISPKIPGKKKIVQILLLIVMLLSFSLNIPNYIWHGMHYPNSLPCRQSFLYTIVLLAMCYEGFASLPYLSKKQLLGCFWGDAAFVLVLQVLLKDNSDIEWYAFYLTLGFLALYVLLVWLWMNQRLQAFTAICIAIVLLSAETAANMAVTSVTHVDRNEYLRNLDNYQILLDSVEETEDTLFYRVEKSSRRTKNDGAFVGYASASIFSSATEAGITDFYKTFGMEGSTNAYAFTGATPLMESILSVRYRISSSELTSTRLMEYSDWEDTAFLYHNLYTLPLGFLVPDDISDYFATYTGTPADAQNALVNLTTGTGPVLEDVFGEESGDTFTFTPQEEGHYYAYIGNHKVTKVTTDIGGSTKTRDNVDRGYLVDLGVCYEGADISITSENGQSPDVSLYRFNEDHFIAWYMQMREGAMEVTELTNDRSSTSITGTVTASENKTLFFSLPYEEGWSVTVDGRDVTTLAFSDAFLSIPLGEGTHTIHLEYHTPGLAKGALISVGSLVLTILSLFGLTILGRFRKKKKKSSDIPAAAAPAPTPVPEEEVLLEDEEFLEEPEEEF